MLIEAIETTIPPDAPDLIVGTASRNRWIVPSNGFGVRFILPDTISSAADLIKIEDLDKDAWILVSDASTPGKIEKNFEQALPHLNINENHAPIYIANRHTRRELVNKLMEKIGSGYEVTKASVDGSGYGDNRDTLDNIIAGLTRASGHPVNLVAIDDDVVLRSKPLVWRSEKLAELGIEPLPNSQVVFAFPPDTDKSQFLELLDGNNLKAFIDPLGQTVAQLREKNDDIKVSEVVIDTRPPAFEKALRGEPAQFIVSPDSNGLLDADSGIIIATTEDKSGLPDYPTWIISKGVLENEFPPEEPVEAYPSGPKVLYAGQRSETIFPDSALFGRRFNASVDNDPAFWPWWHVSSLKISKEYNLLNSSNRSDNDFLPKWLKYIHEKTGKLYLYASGLPTYAQHSRTPFGGDRRDPGEAALASQIGNIAAVETFKRFEFPRNGTIYMRPVEDNYSVPEDHAQTVFDRMQLLIFIGIKKAYELIDRLDNTTNSQQQHELTNKIGQYIEAISSLGVAMRGFDYGLWKKNLDAGIAKQLNFTSEWLDTKPKIIYELGQTISKGEYPIIEIKKHK